MSSSVTLSIATNSTIAVAKGFGWVITGSPTLFAETVHSLADVGNQVLLKVGEVRGRGGPTREHPFGRAQEKFFWALVSAVSVFFIGCGINVYHGVHALLAPEESQPFTLLVIGLLLFSLALELWTFYTAWREIGGWKGVRENRTNVTVLAVLLEDGVAVFGILLTLLVAGVARAFSARGPEFDAGVAILVGLHPRRHGRLPRRAQPPAADRHLGPGDRRRDGTLARSGEDSGRRPLAGARRRPRRRLRPRGRARSRDPTGWARR